MSPGFNIINLNNYCQLKSQPMTHFNYSAD